MRSILRAQLARLASVSVLSTILTGCAVSGCVVTGGCSGARQDRTITFSANGTQVAVQHDRDGIFVADPETGDIRKIFDPTPDVVAASSPLWNPKDERLIFTTAVDPAQRPEQFDPRENPDGRFVFSGPVSYTCWLRPAPDADGNARPQPLFKARCGNAGYVAANLAVRWCPDGNRILYIGQNNKGQHELFQYDLQSGESKCVFPHSAPALVFDFSPDNAHLACVLAGNDDDAGAGIWLGTPGTESWWQVPESQMPSASGDELECARVARPVWSRDGESLAFIKHARNGPGSSGQYSLTVVSLAEHERLKLMQVEEPLTDLHWSPDGTQLAFIRGGQNPRLEMIDRMGKRTNEIPDVRLFAGWNHAGDKLAYVVSEKPASKETSQCILLQSVPNARDEVVIQSRDGSNRTVFSGMHASFPAWSPKDEKLTVWFTFEPTHRSLFESLYGFGLGRGDPAAVLDTSTGDIRWLAVNDFENAQVGHFCLLNGKAEQAWQWYQRAKDAPKRAETSQSDFLRDLYAGRDYRFFEIVCLRRLGHLDEANEKLSHYNASWDNAMKHTGDETPGSRLLKDISPIGWHFLRQFYAAEVFFSLDAVDEGCEYFHFALAHARSDDERYAIRFVLAQMLLAQGRNLEYARLATNELWPLLLTHRTGEQLFAPRSEDNLVCNETSMLTPLLSSEFLHTLTPENVEELVPSWVKFSSGSRNDEERLWADLFLYAAYGELNETEKQLRVRDRMKQNPLCQQFPLNELEILRDSHQ
jgi:Tol biopolymer transport system component